MKKRILFIGLLLSTGLPSFAQQTTTAAPYPAYSSSVAHADSVGAIQELFRKHRTGGVVWTIIGAAFTVRIVTASTASGSEGASGTAAGVVVFGGIPAGIGVGKLARFSRAREEAALATFEAHKPLPNYVRRRLKRKYFSR